MSRRVWAGWPRSNIISLSAKQYQILSNEGVHILPVKFDIGPHQDMCSPQGSSPVKIKHASISRTGRISAWLGETIFLGFLLLFSAAAALAQKFADNRSDPGHRQSPHPQGDHPGPTLHPSRRHIRSRLRLSATLTRFGIPGYFAGPSHRARRYGEGHHPERLRARASHDSRDQLQGQQLGQHVGHSRPLQEGKGRPVGRGPVRPDQDRAGGSGFARDFWPSMAISSPSSSPR